MSAPAAYWLDSHVGASSELILCPSCWHHVAIREGNGAFKDQMRPVGAGDLSVIGLTEGVVLCDSCAVQLHPQTDTLPTGEQQPRLPGDVGAVRDVEVKIEPIADVPFSLTPPPYRPVTIQAELWYGPGDLARKVGA